MALECFTELLGSLFNKICKGDEDVAETFERLPECLVVDIMSRLPFDRLLRNRRVCRHWRALISSSEYFTTLHLSRARPMLLLQDDSNISKRGQCLYVFGEDCNNKKRFRKLNLRPELLINTCWDHYPTLLFSCQGVLLFADFRWLSTYYVFNPVTQEEVTVQHTLHPGYLCALYFCPLARAFKILYVKVRDNQCRYFFYNFKMQTWMKTRSPYSFNFLPGAGYSIVNGALHWITEHDLEKRGIPPCANGIMVFSMGKEEFSTMPHPGSPCNSKRVHRTMTLFAKDDCLSFCHLLVSEYAVDIWILENYEIRTWIKRYKVNISDKRIFPFSNLHYNEMRGMSEGWWIKLLDIQDNELLFELSDEGLVSYNLDHNTVKRIEFPQRKRFVHTCKPFVKSLLAIA